MSINLIAAVGRRGQLGLNGRLPWHDPVDLAWFKQMTQGGVVLVGPKTALNLPTLPGRRVVVDQPQRAEPGLTLEWIKNTFSDRPEIWVAGGAQTYARFMPFIERYYIAQIDYDGPADVWLPPLGWQTVTAPVTPLT